MEEVQKYDPLYNKFSKEYRDKYKKINCWKAIGEKFDLSPEHEFSVDDSQPPFWIWGMARAMLLDPGPLGLHSSIIWKPSITAVAAIAEPFLSAIAAITAIVAIIWKPSFKLPKISKTTTLRVHHAFLYISLPSLHDYDVNCLISRFIDNVNMRRRNSLSLFKLEYFS